MTSEQHNKLSYQFIEEIRKIYSSFDFGYRHGSEVNHVVTSEQIEFVLSPKALTGLDYGCINSNEFIHYTSLDALYGILNSGEIRLYDLNNMNDPYEFNYIVKKLNLPISEDQIEFFKRYLFITSLCAYDETTKDDFDMWRLYGKEGKGVAIVFDILNKEDDWFNFLLGKVQYGNSNQESEKLKKAIEVFNDFVINKGMKLERIPQLFGFLLMLHKNDIWKNEKEFRLATHLEYDIWNLRPETSFNPLVENSLSYFLQPSGKQVGFISFPLSFRVYEVAKEKFPDELDFEKVMKIVPQIRIKKIITGYALSKEFTDDLNLFVFKMMIDKWKTLRIDVVESHLKEWF